MIRLIKQFFSWITSFFSHAPIDAKPFEKYRKVGGEPEKKSVEKKVIPRTPKPCLYCRGVMMVSVGQIAYTHKECRTNFRSLRFRS